MFRESGVREMFERVIDSQKSVGPWKFYAAAECGAEKKIASQAPSPHLAMAYVIYTQAGLDCDSGQSMEKFKLHHRRSSHDEVNSFVFLGDEKILVEIDLWITLEQQLIRKRKEDTGQDGCIGHRTPPSHADVHSLIFDLGDGSA